MYFVYVAHNDIHLEDNLYTFSVLYHMSLLKCLRVSTHSIPTHMDILYVQPTTLVHIFCVCGWFMAMGYNDDHLAFF